LLVSGLMPPAAARPEHSYAHWDCMHPDRARILQERTDLSASSKRKILGDNAARFYKLPVPAGV